MSVAITSPHVSFSCKNIQLQEEEEERKKEIITYADWGVFVVMTVHLADDATRSGHAVT